MLRVVSGAAPPARAAEVSDEQEANAAVSLAQRIRAGDAAAEAELVARYSRGLLTFLRRQNAALADDLHQETFKIVLLRLREQELEDPSRLSGFLLRTARNLLIAEQRKFHRRQTYGDDEQLEAAVDPAPSQLAATLGREDSWLVRQLIEQLKPDRDRHLLYRYYVAEEPKERLCDEWGLSSLQFNRVLFRARQRFKELLELARGGPTSAPTRGMP
jgi:RNA polymerase sigma-70 factor (ECF subfamily)